MGAQWETVWEFRTARFAVTCAVAPEDDDPAGQFDAADDVAFAREGGWHWFMARVRVAFIDADNPKNWAMTRERVLGEDYLGGLSYHGWADFKSGGYFRDMVSEATKEARGSLARMCACVKASA
jgi:hypothetical protein